MRDTMDAATFIKQSVSAWQAGELLGLRPNKAGFCVCPIHGDKDPSMKLYPGNRGFHCFGCHAHGSVIDLVMQIQGCTFREAMEWLNDSFALGLDLQYKPDRKTVIEAQRASQRKRIRREQDEQIDRLLYDCYVLSGMLLNGLEQDAEKNRPRRPYGEWPEQYGAVMHLLPEARALNEWLTVLVMEAKK